MHVMWLVLMAVALALTAVGCLELYCTANGGWPIVLALGSAGVAMVALGRTAVGKDISMVWITTRLHSTLVLGVLVLAAVVSTHWVRLNISPSTPLGLYRLAAVTRPLTHGTLVVLPVPVSIQPWHSPWVPLLKPVAAVAGDVVCVWGGTLWVWTQPGSPPRWYGLVWQQAQGKMLPRIDGCLAVEAGHIFLASAARNSLDSRYFGTVPVTTITAQAVPLFTWR